MHPGARIMSINDVSSGRAGLSFSLQSIHACLKQGWSAFCEERRRKKLRTALYSLGDRELEDIGVSRGMIEHISLNPTVDPRFVAGPLVNR